MKDNTAVAEDLEGDALENLVVADKVSINGAEYDVTGVADGFSFFHDGEVDYTSEYASIVKTVYIPDSVTDLSVQNINEYEYLFKVVLSFNNATSIRIPENTTKFPDGLFFGCQALTSFTIPDTVTEIGERAFYMSGLTSITIPASVKKIGSAAFGSCSALKTVTFYALKQR